MNAFQRHLRESTPLAPVLGVPDVGFSPDELRVSFTPKEVRSIINRLDRGKCPGHDSLSIKRLKYTNVHLPRVLAMFLNLCLSHVYTK